MKKLFVLLFLALLALGLASCDDEPAHIHSFVVKSTESKYLKTAADCENAATYYYSCACGEKGTPTFTSGSAKGHSFVVKSTESKYLKTTADCENAATYYYSCACGEKGPSTFTSGSANGHSFVVENTDSEYLATAADCENAATYYHSCACGKKGTSTFTSGRASGHNYTVKSTESKYLKKAADCENAATYYYSCACGKKGTSTFTSGSANGHSYVVENTDSKYLLATADCENAATYYYSCACGKKGTSTFTSGSANGHSFVVENTDSKYLATAADCENAATYYYSCACGEKGPSTFTSGSANGHSFVVENADSEYLATAADCENAATYYYSCACGKKGTSTFTSGSANGHSFVVENTDSEYLATAADCENAATYYHSCACGEKGTSTFTSGSTRHAYTVKSTESKYLKKAADCENAATYYYSCACGEKGTSTFTSGSANEHSFVVENVDPKYQKTPASEYTPAVYWKSCACGKASSTATFTHGDSLEGYLTYQLSPDSSFYIVTGFVGAKENITIPHIYDALPVFGIMANAFKNNTTLKSISMPNSIQEIGSYAFAGCTALESVSIPTSVKSIFSYTFSGCTSLKTITLHSGIEEIGAFAFENCTSLKSITLNEGLKTISNNAFDNCSSLEGITIPDTVTSLGNMAFRKAVALKYVNFSKSLESIGNATFQDCASLESVELPENITSLGNSTFSDCRGLKTLRILGDLKSIGFSTFYECRNLTSIYFASKNTGNCGNTNYIFYNAGIEGDGITLTIAKDAVIPEGFFTPYVDDNMPKITKIIFEDGTSKIEYFKTSGNLPYLQEVIVPISVTHISAKAFYGCSSLKVNTVKDCHHYFGGWYDNASFTGNAVNLNSYTGSSELLYAKWIPYSLALDKNISVAGNISGSGKFAENQAVTVIAETNPGYTFLGWYENGVSVSANATYTFNITKATSLTAKWKANTYTITFDADGGTIPKSITVTYNENYTLPETNRTGYTFNGWFNGDMQYADDIWFGLSSITLKAKWTANTYNVTFDDTVFFDNKITVTFDYNYSGSTPSTVTLTNGQTLTYPTNPIRENYVFTGWYTDSACISRYSLPTKITGDMTLYLYAGWQSISTYNSSAYNSNTITPSNYTSSSALPMSTSGTSSSAKKYLFLVAEETGTHYVYYKNSSSPSSYKYYLTITNITTGASIKSSGTVSSTSYASVSFSCNAGDVIMISVYRYSSYSTAYFYFDGFNVPASAAFADLPDAPKYEYDTSRSFSTTVTYDSCITLPILAQPYHNFLGWYNGNEKVESGNWSIASDVTLVPKWEPIDELKDFTFTYSNSGVEITGVIDKTKNTYIIPECVTSVASSAFANCVNLVSITVPDSVISIGEKAFYGCYSLESMTLPFTGASASASRYTAHFGYIFGYSRGCCDGRYNQCPYDYCNYSPNHNPSYCYSYYIPASLKSVTITGNVSSFRNCDTLVNVTLGSESNCINGSAFYGCINLVNVRISDGVTVIGYGIFEKCTSLTNIDVDENNNYYMDIDGNLYTKDGKMLIQYALGKTDVTFSIPDGVENIYTYAFMGCYELKSVTIPNSVKNIGSSAFYLCNSLVNVNYIGTVEEWCNIVFASSNSNPLCCAKNLYINGELATELVIADGVTQINDYAFYGCDTLASIIIPNSVTSIGYSAFEGCISLASITVPDSVTSIEPYAFCNCNNPGIFCEATSKPSGWDYQYWNFDAYPVVWGYIGSNGITSSGLKWASTQSGIVIFGYNGTDTEILIPATINGICVFAIADSGFRGNTIITKLILNNNVTSIGAYAFYNCTSLTNAKIPSSLISIGDYAFSGCTSLVYNEYDNAYYLGDDNNNYVVLIKAKNTSISSCIINENTKFVSRYAFSNCANLSNVIIPDNVIEIGDGAFSGCTALSNVVIGKSVISIGEDVFRECDGITNITIPDNVISLGSSFSGCSNLTVVNIGNGLKSIDAGMFFGCDNLTDVIIGTGVRKIGNAAFFSCRVKNVYYRGTEDEWNLISIVSLNNSSLLNAQKYYNYGTS